MKDYREPQHNPKNAHIQQVARVMNYRQNRTGWKPSDNG